MKRRIFIIIPVLIFIWLTSIGLFVVSISFMIIIVTSIMGIVISASDIGRKKPSPKPRPVEGPSDLATAPSEAGEIIKEYEGEVDNLNITDEGHYKTFSFNLLRTDPID